MDENKYNLVNWQESMDVGHRHLQQTENYFIERLGDNLATRLTSFNYGLLPSSDRRKSSTEFEINESITGKVEIRLRSCNAVTAGGYRISYNPVHTEYLTYAHSFEETPDKPDNPDTKYWDVILSVSPFDRIPAGIPDEREYPPRHPDVREPYRLSIAAQGHTNYEQLGRYHLVIGRIRKYGKRYEVDSNYIPACTSMCSHPDLLKYYESFGGRLNDMEKASRLIISKIRNRTQNTPLAFHIAVICENIMRYISGIYFHYRNTGRDALPVEIAGYFSTLAHICSTSLDFISKTEKEELLKYFYEWSDITPGSFGELLSDTLSLRYDHHNIRPVMLQADSFLQVLSGLWLRLGALEYIGQHKENIVISERSYQQETKKKESGSWTILD
jgi:hypothetical protein